MFNLVYTTLKEIATIFYKIKLIILLERKQVVITPLAQQKQLLLLLVMVEMFIIN